METTPSELLRQALRKKGIGPKGSKSISNDLLKKVIPFLSDSESNKTTAAALWTAILLLDNTNDELELLLPLMDQPEMHLIPELQALTAPETVKTLENDFLKMVRQIIHKKDLSSS